MMVIVQDFVPCVEDELEVSRGQVVRLIFQENDWMFVEKTESPGKGFVPYTYCLPVRKEEQVNGNEGRVLSVNARDSCSRGHSTDSCGDHWPISKLSDQSRVTSQHNVQQAVSASQCNHTNPASGSFMKRDLGKYIVLFDFWSEEENDVCVQRGEFVTLLNRDDSDWFWVSKTSEHSKRNTEGFVPASFLLPAVVPNADKGRLFPQKGQDIYIHAGLPN
jgi:hypothetical protein